MAENNLKEGLAVTLLHSEVDGEGVRGWDNTV